MCYLLLCGGSSLGKRMQRVNDKKFNKHWIYLDDEDIPVLIPCLYSRYTTRTGLSVVHEKTKNHETGEYEFRFKEIEVGEDAQNVRGSQLGLFLEWVEDYDHELVTLTSHTALPSEYINQYVNDHLIHTMEKSEIVVNRAVIALKSYYDWLSCYFGNSYKKIIIFSENRAIVRANNKSKLIVKYLLPATKELLYRNTSSLLEEIVLRNGGELGCRTSENQGFYLEDFTADGKKQRGLLSIFKELEDSPGQEEFEYQLPSYHAKYGSNRILYIERSHLELMKRYYETERPITESNHLLVSNSRNHSKGKVVAKSFGTTVFTDVLKSVRKKVNSNPEAYNGYQHLDEAQCYHHLRHSFGTDIFYELCVEAGKNFESITTESRVYIETARRLGHKVDSKFSNQTTKIYIHACGLRQQLLKEVVNG